MSGYICGYIFMADFYVANYKQHTGAYESLTLQIIEKSGNPSSDRGFVILRFVQFVQVFQGITILLLSVLTKRRGSYKGMDQTTVRNAMAVLNRKSTVLQTVL